MNKPKQDLITSIVYVSLAAHMLSIVIDMKTEDGWDYFQRLALLFLAVAVTCAATLFFKRAIEP